MNRRAPAPRPASSLPLTNARRLQLGLPLKKPHRKVDKVKRSGTPPTSSVSSRNFFLNKSFLKHIPSFFLFAPGRINCNILVNNTDSGDVLGYVSPKFNDFGEYGYFQPSQDGALSVTLSYHPRDPSSPVDIKVNNGPDSTFPFFGAGEYCLVLLLGEDMKFLWCFIVVGYASTSDDLGVGNPK